MSNQGNKRLNALIAAASTPPKRSRALTRTKTRFPLTRPVKVFVGKQPFPKQLFNTLRYVDGINITMTAGAGKQIYSCNGLYDPDITGAGHQPLYFDQLMAVYDHYTVLRSRIKISPSTSANFNGLFTIYVDDDTSTVTNATVALERIGAIGFACNPSITNPMSLRLSWDAAKTFGPNPQAQDSLQGNVSTNPSEQSYYVIQVQDYAAGTPSVSCVVELEFDVVWDEFVTIAQS